MPPHASIPEHAIACFERVHGLMVTVHDYDGHLRGMVGNRRLSHRHRRCMAVKASAESRCLAFDGEEVRRELLPGSQARLRRCHGGVCEAAVACHRDGRVAWVVFAGPLAEQPGSGDDVLESLCQLAARLRQWEDEHGDWPPSMTR